MWAISLRRVLLGTLAFAFVATPLLSSAPSASAAEELVACSQYSKQNEVKLDVSSEITSTVSGATVAFVGTVENTKAYAVPDGAVYAKVFRKQSREADIRANGHILVDEFLAAENLNLKAGESRALEFTWKVPAYAVSGDYEIALYFLGSGQYHLSGYAFTDTIVAAKSEFSVKGEQSGLVQFNRNAVTVGGEDYLFAAMPPRVSSDQSVVVEATLTNTTGRAQSVPVTWTLYRWDAFGVTNKIESLNDTVALTARGSETVTYTLEDTRYPVYFLRAEAQYEDARSIMDIRIVRQNKDGLVIDFPGVTGYPLKAGQESTLFACFHNVGQSDSVENAKLTLALYDSRGREITQHTYQGQAVRNLGAVATAFTPKRDYDAFTLKAVLAQGDTVVEEASVTYDCQAFGDTCMARDAADDGMLAGLPEISNRSTGAGLIALICIVALAVLARALWKSNRMKNQATIVRPAAQRIVRDLCLALAATGALLAGAGTAEAKTSTYTFSTDDFTVGYNEGATNPATGQWEWKYGIGSGFDGLARAVVWQFGGTISCSANVINAATGNPVSEATPVPVGTRLLFQPKPLESTDAVWYLGGGECPYGYWVPGAGKSSARCAATDSNTNGRAFYIGQDSGGEDVDVSAQIFTPFSVNPWDITVAHEDNGTLQCNAAGTDCLVVAAGTIKSTFTCSATQAKLRFQYKYQTGSDTTCYDYDGPVSSAKYPAYYPIDVAAQTIPFSFTAQPSNPNNRPPLAPTIVGPIVGSVGTPYTFTVTSTDPDNDEVRYGVDWDKNGTVDEWLPALGFVASGTSQTVTHTWTTTGPKTFQALTADKNGALSGWTTHTITLSQNYLLTVTKAGDGSGSVDSTPAGIACGASCASQSAPFLGGSTVTLTATPSADSLYPTWTGCDSVSGGTCTVLMSGARNVTADFQKKPVCLCTDTQNAAVCAGQSYVNSCGTTCTGTRNCSGDYTEVNP